MYFAHGVVLVAGAYLGYFLFVSSGSMITVVADATLGSAIVDVAVKHIAVRPVRHTNHLIPLRGRMGLASAARVCQNVTSSSAVSEFMKNRHLDLHLLRCFSVLITERHVTRAAERLNTSQPAMSAILGRLRKLFDDPLLVRTEKGMFLTNRAIEIGRSVDAALALIDGTLHSNEIFNPATAVHEFKIAASESVTLAIMPSLISRVHQLAPSVTLCVRVPDLARMKQALEEAQTDILISFTKSAPSGLRSSTLLRQSLKVVVSKTHPDIRDSLSIEQFVSWPHAGHRIDAREGSTIEKAVDKSLNRLGLTRSMGAWLPSAVSLISIVAEGPFIATVPEAIADRLVDEAGVRAFDPPLMLDEARIGMFWHDRMHDNSAHRWLRGVLRTVVSELKAEPTPE